MLSGQVGVAQVTLMAEITRGLWHKGLLSIHSGSSLTTLNYDKTYRKDQ